MEKKKDEKIQRVIKKLEQIALKHGVALDDSPCPEQARAFLASSLKREN